MTTAIEQASEARITELEHNVKTLAWLHAGLVHELKELIAQMQLAAPGMVAQAQRNPEIVARAQRIAAHRRAKAMPQ